MLFGAILGFAVGIAVGWLGAPLAGKELRARATSPSGRRSLADALKRRDQTLAGAQRAAGEARQRAESAAKGAADAASDVAATAQDRVTSTARNIAEQERSLVDRIKERLDEARDAAQEGYDQGVADATQLYDDVRKGRDLEEESEEPGP